MSWNIKNMNKKTLGIANSGERELRNVQVPVEYSEHNMSADPRKMLTNQSTGTYGQMAPSRSWHHSLSTSDHSEFRMDVPGFDSHRRLSHGSRTALFSSHDSHLRLRDPKTTSASSSPEKSPGIESDDSLSSASSSGHRQAAYRKRSLRHRRSEDRDLGKLLTNSVEEAESLHQRSQLGVDDGRGSRTVPRNGHRPASVCGYNVLWENRVQELVVSTNVVLRVLLKNVPGCLILAYLMDPLSLCLKLFRSA